MNPDRAISCLYGGLIGDALGGRYEFDYQDNMGNDKQRFESEWDWEILGGGSHELEPGQITDDSEMAMAMAAAIIKAQKVDKVSIAKAYHNWYLSEPFDIGNSTRNAVQHSDHYQMVEAAKEFNDDCIKKHQDNNLSNGFLMRIGPLGVICSKYVVNRKSDRDFVMSMIKMVSEDTLLTHYSEEALCYAVAFVILLGFAIVEGRIDSAVEILRLHLNRKGDWKKILEAGLDMNSKLAHDPRKRMGDVRIAFQLAIRKAYLIQSRQMTFEEAIVSTVKLGGDTDTNACIVGYLCGAVSNKVPAKWVQSVKNPVERIIERYQVHQPNQLIGKIPQVVRSLLSLKE